MPRVDKLRQWARAHANGTLFFLFVIVVIILLQDGLSDQVKVGRVLSMDVREFFAIALANRIWVVIKLVVLVPTLIFWVLGYARALRWALLLSLLLLTVELLAGIAFLVLGLTQDTARVAIGLVRDTLTVAVINILAFSLWYWWVDGFRDMRGIAAGQADEFLFPPYTTGYPRFSQWQPGYPDYLFLAFTTSTAFGPTDTLPLTARGKMLMMAQAAFSLVIIIVLAGRALSILR